MASEVLKRERTIYQDGKFHLSMRILAYIFFFTIFFLPDYFGIDVGFGLNIQRMALIGIWIWILGVGRRRKQMASIVVRNKTNPAIILYMFVSIYTGLYRADIGAILNPLLDIFLVYYTTIYFLKWEITEEELLREVFVLAYILCFLGIVEYALKKPIFAKLEFIKGMFAGVYIRGGVYHIMGPAHHPLGYGLYLLLVLPLSCINFKERKLDMLERPILLLLLMLNIYLTASRAALGLMGGELVALVLLSGKKERERYFVLGGCLIAIVLLLMIMFINTRPVQKIIIMVVSAIDGALGTTIGKDVLGVYSLQEEQSTEYRQYLPMIFSLPWLNPIMGRGVKYHFSMYVYGYLIKSIDNFYINQYIKLAYPGLAASLILFLSNLRYLVSGMIISKDPIYKALAVSLVTYFVNLWYVDALGTLDYVFVLFAVLYVHYKRDAHALWERRTR